MGSPTLIEHPPGCNAFCGGYQGFLVLKIQPRMDANFRECWTANASQASSICNQSLPCPRSQLPAVVISSSFVPLVHWRQFADDFGLPGIRFGKPGTGQQETMWDLRSGFRPLSSRGLVPRLNATAVSNAPPRSRHSIKAKPNRMDEVKPVRTVVWDPWLVL